MADDQTTGPVTWPEPEARSEDGTVTYVFPVEIEVIGELGEQHVRAVARHVFDELDNALRSRA